MKVNLAVIIEDDSTLAYIYSITLQRANFKTEIFHSGIAAMARLKEIVPDLLVLDIHLPQMTGQQVLDSLRQDARFKKTPIIVATADATLARETAGNADLVLLKPVSSIQLRQLAQRIVT